LEARCKEGHSLVQTNWR